MVLVHHEVAVLLADLASDVIVLGEQRGRAQQDVVEVDLATVALGGLVAGEDLGDLLCRDAVDLAPGGTRQRRVLPRGDIGDLGPAHLGQQVTQQRRVDAEALLLRGLGHQTHAPLGHLR